MVDCLIVNGEGDRLGGLIVDVLGDMVVVQSSAFWVEHYKHMIHKVLTSILGPSYHIIWRQAESRLRQDGFTGELDATLTAAVGGEANVDQTEVSSGKIVFENGVRYAVNPEDGQKTGFYAGFCFFFSSFLLFRV